MRKFNLLLLISSVILGVLNSLNSYGCLVYTSFCVMNPVRLLFWDQTSHLLGFFAMCIFGSVVVAEVAYLLKKCISNLLYSPRFLFWLSIIVSCIGYGMASYTYEVSGKHGADLSAILFDFLGFLSYVLFFYLFKEKIIYRV